MEKPTQPIQDLGTLGGTSSYGTSINAFNHVVGYSTTGDDRVHAFLYIGGKMQDLGTLGGKDAASDQSYALGINADRSGGGLQLPPVRRDALRFSGQPGNAAQQVAFLLRSRRDA